VGQLEKATSKSKNRNMIMLKDAATSWRRDEEVDHLERVTTSRQKEEHDHVERCNNIMKVRWKNGSSWNSSSIRRLEEEYNHLERPTPKGLEHKSYNMKRGKYEHQYLIALHSTLCICNKKHTHKWITYDKKENTNLKNQSNMERFIYMERSWKKAWIQTCTLELGRLTFAYKSYNYNSIFETLKINHGLCHILGSQ